MLALLFLFTVLAGLAGATWELVTVTRLLRREHPEERTEYYPALVRRIETLNRDPEWPAGLEWNVASPFTAADRP